MHQTLAFAELVAVVMIDAWPELKLQPVWMEPPRVYAATKDDPGVVLAELPMPKDETLNTAYMYFSVWHWFAMVNGYSGYVPASYKQLRSDIARFPNGEAIDALRRRGVTHVTINCGLGYPGCDERLDAMQRAPRLRLLANTRWMGSPVQLYELLAP